MALVVLAPTGLTLALAGNAESAAPRESRELVSLVSATIKKSFSGSSTDGRKFSVHGRLTRIRIQKSSQLAKVSCDVSMVVTSQPKNSMVALLSNSGSVQTHNSPKAIEEGKQDCVVAVVESMISEGVASAIRLPAR